MDWNNYKFWRKDLRRMDAKTAEFDLLVQGTIDGIVLGDKIRRCVQLLQWSSNNPQKVSKRKLILRKLGDLRQNLFIRKRF